MYKNESWKYQELVFIRRIYYSAFYREWALFLICVFLVGGWLNIDVCFVRFSRLLSVGIHVHFEHKFTGFEVWM